MRQINIYILSAAFLLITVTTSGLQADTLKSKNSFLEEKLSTAQDQDIARQVQAAFNEVRKNGETTRLSQLESLGEKLIPYLEPYLKEVNANIRAEAVNLALKIGGEKAFDFAVLALQNSRPQIRKETAANLYFYYSQYKKYLRHENSLPSGDYSRYKSFSSENIAANQLMGSALRTMVKSGNSNVEAIFLLANFPDEETKIALKGSFKRRNYTSNSRIRYENALAAEITLARINNQETIEYLSKQANLSNIETLKFLLKNITEIESPKILLALSKTLENKTYIEGKLTSAQIVQKFRLPKGSHVDTIPLRLCDLAVESFVKKLDLKTSFKLHSGIYAEQHISEVQDLTRQRLSEK